MKAVKNKKRLLMGLSKTKLGKAKIIFFNGRTRLEQRIYEMDESCAMFGHSSFDTDRKTVLYIHGYLEAPANESVAVVVDAYLKRNDHNILVLDWSELADGNYIFDVVPNAKQLARKMSEIVLDWIDEGLDVNKFHVVGHSLGGQLAGIIGRYVHRKSTGESKLVRITALDPACPLFYHRLSKNDAEFVDIIHTDEFLYNVSKSTGTVDFWPNGGHTLQPGCPQRNWKPLTDNDLCSHRRSWCFWAESVRSMEHSIFLSVLATSWNNFKKGRVVNSAIIQMGLDCPLDAQPGNYFLQTNASKPFAKGVRGLQYEKVKRK